jgi:polyvinyl alcohol dehydrogenase (cytochrome)
MGFVTRVACIAIVTLLSVALADDADSCKAKSHHWGIDYNNSRYQPCTKLSPTNAHKLVEACRIPIPVIAGQLSHSQSQATIDGDDAYLATHEGHITKFSTVDCTVHWQVYLPTVLSITAASSRNTGILIPHRGVIVYGLQTPGQPRLFALNLSDGSLSWLGPKLDGHPNAIITASGVYVKEKHSIYLGISSTETTSAYAAGYPCCSFAGSFVRVSADDGSIVLHHGVPAKRYTTNPTDFNADGVTLRFPGNAVWGSSAVIDLPRNAMLLGAGDNYKVTPEFATCVTAVQTDCGTTGTDPQEQFDVKGLITECVRAGYQRCGGLYNSKDNFVDSVFSLDLDSLDVNWRRQMLDYDAWNLAAFSTLTNPNRPSPLGPDSDFGQGPIGFTYMGVDVISACQKNGYCHVFNRDTGAVVVSNQIGTGGDTGGYQWGSALDVPSGAIISTQVNSQQFPHALQNGSLIYYGSIQSINADLQLNWEEPDPFYTSDVASNQFFDPCGAVAAGGGLAITTSLSGWVHVWDVASGARLKSFNPNVSSIGSGASIFKRGFVIAGGYQYRDRVPTATKAIVVYRLP